MAFTTDELEEMKYHLGYTNLTAVAYPWFEIANIFVDIVKNQTTSWGETQVRGTILPNLRAIEAGTMDQLDRRQADELIGELKLNKNELSDILDARDFWLSALERVIGVKRVRHTEASSIEVY